MKRSQAFTLVELLVVVAIIALLLAILLPALNKAREAARATVCAAQMKQIGQMYVNYTVEYKGYYPLGNTGTVSLQGMPPSYTWRDLFKDAGYVPHQDWISTPPKRSAQARYYCPSNPQDGNYTYGMPESQANSSNLKQLGLMGRTGRPANGETEHWWIRQPQVSHEVETLTLYEVSGFITGGDAYNYVNRWYNWVHYEGKRQESGASNYLFADGHVELHTEDWMRPDAMGGRWTFYRAVQKF